MATTEELMSIDYHTDSETGMYNIGEIDWGIRATLNDYIQKYGYEGVKEILATLGHLAYEVKAEYYRQTNKVHQGEQA